MIIDVQNEFSDAQAITASAVSTNVIALSEERRIGSGKVLYIIVSVQDAFTDAGSDSTVAVTLQADDNEGFSSPTTIATLGTFPALSANGDRLILLVPPDVLTEEFIRLNYVVAGGDLTTGSLDAFILEGIDSFQSYPDNVEIS